MLQKLEAGLQELTAGQQALVVAQQELKQVVTVVAASALDLWEGRSTTNSERKQFRAELFKHYYKLQEPPADTATCMVSGIALPSSDVTAAHIWPARARSAMAALFGLKLQDLNSYRNGILMADSLERQFDAQRVAFSYDFMTDKFAFHVLDPKLKKQTPAGLKVTFESLEGKVLQHPSDKVPFRRLLVWHYAGALKRGVSEGYLTPADVSALPRVLCNTQLARMSPGATLPSDFAWPEVARALVDETRRASDAEGDDSDLE